MKMTCATKYKSSNWFLVSQDYRLFYSESENLERSKYSIRILVNNVNANVRSGIVEALVRTLVSKFGSNIQCSSSYTFNRVNFS